MRSRPQTGGATRGITSLLVAVLLAGLAAASTPPPVAADTSTASVEAAFLAWTNRDRAARGMRPLRLDSRLAALADERAGNLVAATSFSHAAAGGGLSVALGQANVQAYASAENLASWPGGLRSGTGSAIYNAWKRSPSHWATLMSRNLNYVGFGVAVRSSDGRVFASAVFTESRDHTAPSTKIDSATRSGTTIRFAWHGYDAPLQSHWAGVRDYDVWYRIDDGDWRVIRNDTPQVSLSLTGRPGGHRYWLRLQARDRAGNVGSAGAPASVWVP